MDETTHITRLLQTTPPSCIAGFRLTPAELPIAWDDNTRSPWRLVCICGGERGAIIGQPFKDFKPDAENGGNLLVGPIGFQCAACGRLTEVIETDIHGYSSEVLRREAPREPKKNVGEKRRASWQCPKCERTLFTLTVAFIFWDATYDLAEDDPTWPTQEFFCVFLSFATCVNCGHVSQPTDFGKL